MPVDNMPGLLDEEHSEAGFVPQPGRRLIGGIKVSFRVAPGTGRGTHLTQ